ncbi:MAG: helix-turn-helix domain-containing protein, partial [bacterium]
MEQGSNIRRIDPDALKKLKQFNFPGNVRELENVLRHATVMAKGDILLPQYLPDLTSEGLDRTGTNSEGGFQFPEDVVSLEEVEKRYIQHALQRLGWKKKAVCEALNIARTTLDRKIEQYGIKIPGN